MKIKHLKQLIREELNNIREEESSAPGKAKLVAALKKAGVDTSKSINIKLVNKDTGKEQVIKYDSLQESFSKPNMEEGIKDTLALGATCFILATGAISCTKAGGGFGYNVSVKGVTHDLQKGDRTKEVTVVTPSGERTEMVNAGDTARFTWGGHGIYVSVKPSAEELQTAAFGAAIRREQSSNNGKGYDANRYIVDATTSEIKLNPGYTDGSAGEPAESIHEHEDYKAGRSAISKFPERWEEFKQMNPIQDYEF